MALSDATKTALDTWQSLVEKQGQLSVVEAQQAQVDEQIETREGFIAEQTEKGESLTGSNIALAQLNEQKDNLAVKAERLAIEIADLKTDLAAANKSAFKKSAKDAMTKDAA